MSEADNRASRYNTGPEQSPDDHSPEALATETRMRRALGLSPGASTQTPQQRPEQARARHRFVQDGGVPVVMLNHKPDADTALRERIAAIEAQLEAERTAHAATRRTLGELQAAHQALQTRLVHAELAHTEALETERRHLGAAQQALAELQASPVRRTRVPEPQPEPTHDARVFSPTIAARPNKHKIEVASLEKPKRGRPRIHPIPEPKPVRWWTPSFKAKSKA